MTRESYPYMLLVKSSGYNNSNNIWCLIAQAVKMLITCMKWQTLGYKNAIQYKLNHSVSLAS